MFTDIHWGKSSNSITHNKDCLDFISWLIPYAQDPEVDAIIFLGDWFDHRTTINVATLDYSFEGAKLLNSIGKPVYLIIGNHDLYYRHTREKYSPKHLSALENIIIINENTVVPHMGDEGALICPYLFHEEYAGLVEYLDYPVWFGHFEFKGFTVTGYNMKMQHGPDHTIFQNGPKQIFSGHFHKRQRQGNVQYIGNCFPHNFADIDDTERGIALYTFDTDQLDFVDWEDCPKFQKVKLSQLLTGNVDLWQNSRVKCICDVPITYEDSLTLRPAMISGFGLREFLLEESDEISRLLLGDGSEEDSDEDSDEAVDETMDELVVKMLKGIESDNIISSTLLLDIFNKIK